MGIASTEGGPRQGYLLLADIAGYTKFLTGTELEHSHAIITELMSLIRGRLAPPLRFVKLEGDAVFCYADAAKFADGERLVEVLEACYVDFANRLFDMERGTTCRCDACAQMGTLDLKFAVHFGTFIVEESDGAVDLAGPDVILAHRLLKNSVTEQLGCSVYALFTSACLARMPDAFPTQPHTESYDSFGNITAGVHDLKAVLEYMRAMAREYIDSTAADLETTFDLPFSPALVWQYCVDADKRMRWQGAYQTGVDKYPNAQGRTGVGSTSHCEHADGKEITRHYLDWRPFRYFTTRYEQPDHKPDDPIFLPSVTETTELVTHGPESTTVHLRVRVNDRSRNVMEKFRTTTLPQQRAYGAAIGANLLEVMREDATNELSDDN